MNIGQSYNPYRLFVGSHVPNWLMERKEISNGAKLCFARLAQYAGECGNCFPGQETLAKSMGSQLRMIQRYLSELEKNELIRIDQRGLQKTNTYHFLWSKWAESDTSKMSCQEASYLTGPLIKEKNQSVNKPPTPFQGDDSAIALVKAYRENFPHYDPKPNPKKTERELRAATVLLASATANEVLNLAASAMRDDFKGNKRAASSLELILKNFDALRGQFSGLKPKISGIARPWEEESPILPQDAPEPGSAPMTGSSPQSPQGG